MFRAGLLCLCALAGPIHATTVRVETVLGVIDIELFDTAAPATVANFLNYVQNSKFDSTFFHRSVAGFVLQGGGYSINTTSNVVAAVPTFAPVVNEYSATRSNLRGTVAMAKLGSSPDSATSQWFVNLANNATNLDFQNGGFTVFGKVIGNGMAVVDAIAKLPVYTVNFGATVGSLTGVPLDMAGASSITAANLATVNRVAVLPSAVNAAAGWNLLGNGSDAPLTVASMFADAQRFVTVWKWVAGSTGGVWAFYSPVLAAQGGSILSDYAAGKGYQVLQSIDAGEGYWLNVAANQAGSINQPYGNAVTTATLNTSLKSGWNLAAIGTTASAKQVCAAQTSGVTSLWAWDNAQSKWFFYAPNLDAQAGTVLSDYILSKSYLDFSAQAKPLGFGQGFWVNRP